MFPGCHEENATSRSALPSCVLKRVLWARLIGRRMELRIGLSDVRLIQREVCSRAVES
jgi:hypothetical protein